MSNDQAGFEAFVAARTAALARTAYLLTGDAHLAEDLVQSALLKAAEHWGRIHTSPEAYVRRTMYHHQVSWWRRRRGVREHAIEGYDAEHRAPDPDVALSVREALALLTTRQRTVLVLRFFEDLTATHHRCRGDAGRPPLAGVRARVDRRRARARAA